LLPLELSELAELGGLTGKRTLHMQCHIGTDTVSLAKLGAHVIGLDFSAEAVTQGRRLSENLDLPATFVQDRVCNAGERFGPVFDFIFTSHGVLIWMPDLDVWATNIAGCMKPEGTFYLSEEHPLSCALSPENRETEQLTLKYPYLSQPRPDRFTDAGSYADSGRKTKANTTIEWRWGIGDVVSALLRAGLQLRWLREHSVGFYPLLPDMVEGADGQFRLSEPHHGKYPLGYSIAAYKA
jgi:SAM-dependent methyltransferase